MHRKFFVLLSGALVLSAPALALAGGVLPSQLVPCGTSSGGTSSPCTLCHLWELANRIISFIFYGLAIPVLTVMLIWGGILMLANFGNPSQITKGRRAITSALLGILITATSYLIISTIINTVAAGKFTVGWATLNCAEPSGGGGAFSGGGGNTGGNTGGSSCNATGQCVAGGGGKTCTANSDCSSNTNTNLQCSAASVSPLVNSIVSCVMSQASARGLSVSQPQPNQLNGGSHTCNLNSSPASISCHYGGTQCNGTGNAVDFSLSGGRTALNWGKLRDLAINCGAAGGAYCEAGSIRPQAGCSASGVDHVHINASASCGCQ